MAGDVVNIKVCNPLKLSSGLMGKCQVIGHCWHSRRRLRTKETNCIKEHKIKSHGKT